MDIRHLRCFVAVAEELHFARAAERLHMEQSPLSRAIKELEYNLGVQLFERTTRSTRLTWAGEVLLEDARRVFAILNQAKANVKAAADGYRGVLRVALSDDIVPSRLATLLAQCRAEEPEIEIRLFQIAFPRQIKGLRCDLYDVGFAQSEVVGGGIVAEPLWRDPLMVVVPVGHPLLAQKRIPLEFVLDYPLVLCHPEACEGCARQIGRILRTLNAEPAVADHVNTHEMLLALVAAGYGIGLTNAMHIENLGQSDVVARPLAGRAVTLTTYLLRRIGEPSEPLRRFIGRAKAEHVSSNGDATAMPHDGTDPASQGNVP